MNESIPDDNENVPPYPLYHVGTTSRDYQMACFVLGNNSVTIQEMHAVFYKMVQTMKIQKWILVVVL